MASKKQIGTAVATIARSGASGSLVKAVEDVATDSSMNSYMGMTMGAMDGFTSPAAAIFAGVALSEEGRRYIDDALDREWKRNAARIPAAVDEAIIGSGPHAAIYAATRVASGRSRPWVVERNDRAGGVFAVSRGPSFFLNSRNRPGELAPPGVAGGALNVLPGSPIQPVDLGGQEYQTNDQLAFAIRISLALNANVATGIEVDNLDYTYDGEVARNRLEVNANDFTLSFRAERAILATGLGRERRDASQGPTALLRSDRVLTYAQFMAKLDAPAPLKDIGRVAVIGGGDGGKTVIEALIGQGPRSELMLPALGRPQSIDWYGPSRTNEFGDEVAIEYRSTWEECNRSRYRGIGRALPRNPEDDTYLVRIRAARANSAVEGFNQVFIEGRPYDTVIDASGYEPANRSADRLTELRLGIPRAFTYGGRIIGRRIEGYSTYTAGPAGSLVLEDYERQQLPVDVPQNTVALFRYADRTATLAAQVDSGIV